MVSVYASASQLVLGQLKTNAKSNEVTTIPALIQMLDLRGAIVTIDAMACQAKIAKAITSKDGAVKGNQGKLAAAIQAASTSHRLAPIDRSIYQVEKQKSRVEASTYHVLNASDRVGDFSALLRLTSIVRVEQSK